MACVVEIANTKHLALSPMNEKHNVLYNKARHILNQRFIQRPWFNLHPALDRQDDKRIENWKENMEIQPLQSLIIVEDYFNEKPLHTSELSLADFWEYLFSNNWSDGYSIRVLEGRLQDLIISNLVTLCRAELITQHSTFAFAKNKRQRLRVYKHSTNTEALGYIEETLLLEFTYYGHLVSSKLQQQQSSCGYPESTTPHTFTSDDITSDYETGVSDGGRFTSAKPLDKRPQTSNVNSQNSSKKKKKQPARNSYKSQKALASVPENSLSHVKRHNGSYARGSRERKLKPASILCSSSDTSWLPPPKIDLKKFLCTEKVSYLGEFELEDDSSSDEEEVREDFGQQFYLGDKTISRFEEGESVEMKLKRRKEELIRMRESKKTNNKEVKPPKNLLPDWHKIDFQGVTFGDYHNAKLAPNEKVPSFSDFLDKPDDNVDPKIMRLRRTKAFRPMRFTVRAREGGIDSVKPSKESLISDSKILKLTRWRKTKNYIFFNPNSQAFADIVGGVTDSAACKRHCLDQDKKWKGLSDKMKKELLLQKYQTRTTSTEKMKKVKRHSMLSVPLVYITTPIGVTYLHRCSRQHKPKAQQKEKKSPTGKRRRTSLIPSIKQKENTSPKSRRGTLTVKEGNSVPISPSPTPSDRMFPKVKAYSDDDSVESSSDSEDSLRDESAFNTKKLNVKYSIERLKTAVRAKEPKKPQTFKTVLKKYYRMQTILKAFSPKSNRRKTSSATAQALTNIRRTGMGFGSLMPKIKETTRPMNIGKLKWFPFLDKPKLLLPGSDIGTHLFENYPMNLFRQNIERALDEFVVRKEIVVSDYNAKSSVSITFTKKSVFTRPKCIA